MQPALVDCPRVVISVTHLVKLHGYFCASTFEMMMKRPVSMLFFLFVVYTTASAQEGTRLTVDEAIAAATTANTEVSAATIDQRIAGVRYRQTAAIYQPQVNLSYSAMTTNNPLNAFGFQLQQRTITAADFNPDKLNHPGATPDFMARIDLQQPLLNLDMMHQRKGAALQEEMARLTLIRTREQMAFETRKAYLQLQLAHEMEKVLQDAVTTATEFSRNTHNLFDQGLVQKSDLLNAEVHLTGAQVQLRSVQSSIRDASDMLSLLMGRAAGMVYLTDSLALPVQQHVEVTELPADRADFLAMQKGMASYDQMMKSVKSRNLPRLNAFASYQWNDYRMFGFGANAYLAGVQLSWSLFNGGLNKNQYVQHGLERDKINTQLEGMKQRSRLQLDQALRQRDDAQLEINQWKAAVEQAREALRVLQNRYAQGLVHTADVLLAQTQLSQQRLGLAQAIHRHALSNATIQLMTVKGE